MNISKRWGFPKRSPRNRLVQPQYYTCHRDDIEHNLEELSALGSLDYLQIDDGWQQAIGDWLEPNAKFPSG